MRLSLNSSMQEKINEAQQLKNRLFAALIDPEDLKTAEIERFLEHLPRFTTHIFIGGSTATRAQMEACIAQLKPLTALPLVLFPGNHKQVVAGADALLFLSLLSGRNPDYLIGEQVKAIPFLKGTALEVIPTGYILIDGNKTTSVARVSNTKPIKPDAIEQLVHTALAGQYSGKKLIYLEAGSGAVNPVPCEAIEAVSKAINIPLVVGGGVKDERQMDKIYQAGATMIVVGTVLEKGRFLRD